MLYWSTFGSNMDTEMDTLTPENMPNTTRNIRNARKHAYTHAGASTPSVDVRADVFGHSERDIDAIVYSGHVHLRVSLIKDILLSFLGNPSARGDVKRNVLVVTDNEFKRTLDQLREGYPVRRFRTVATGALAGNPISGAWVKAFIEGHDTLVVIDDAVGNCTAVNMDKLYNLYETAQLSSTAQVRFVVISHDYQQGAACFTGQHRNLRVIERPLTHHTATAKHYLVELPGKNLKFIRLQRKIAILYAFAQSRNHTSMMDNLCIVHATMLFSASTAEQYLAQIKADWLQCQGRMANGRVRDALTAQKPRLDLACNIPRDLSMSQIVDIATPEQVEYLLRTIIDDYTMWMFDSNKAVREGVCSAYLKMIEAMVAAHQVGGVAIVANNNIISTDVMRDKFDSAVVLLGTGVGQTPPVPVSESIRAARGYIRNPPNRRFSAVIDLFPALTRDPTTLMDLMDPGLDFSTFSFDMSITNDSAETTDNLTRTDAFGSRTKYIGHHLSSIMRLKPSASLYTFQPATRHSEYLKKMKRKVSSVALELSRQR